jgi:zinc protease
MAFKGAGSKNDPSGQEGLAYTTMQMLWRNPDSNMDRNQRSRKIKELGVMNGIDFNLNQDNLIIEFKCPEENLSQIFNIIANMITNCKLEDSELHKIKNFNNTIKLETASEIEFAKYALESKIFSGHPYGTPISGSPNSVQTLSIKDVSNNILNNLAKNNLIIIA